MTAKAQGLITCRVAIYTECAGCGLYFFNERRLYSSV